MTLGAFVESFDLPIFIKADETVRKVPDPSSFKITFFFDCVQLVKTKIKVQKTQFFIFFSKITNSSLNVTQTLRRFVLVGSS
jgi:hypothetical protein